MTGAGNRYLERHRHSHQLSERIGSHLPHDIAAMDLKRDLADAKLARRLLVEKAADYQRQHLALSRCQRTKTSSELCKLPCFPMHFTTLRKGRVDRTHQVGLLEWLGKEVDRARLDRSYG